MILPTLKLVYSNSGVQIVEPFAQAREIAQGADVDIPFVLVGSDDQPLSTAGWTFYLCIRKTDGTLIVNRSTSASPFQLTSAETRGWTSGQVRVDVFGTNPQDQPLMDPSTWSIIDSVFDPTDPSTPPGPPTLFPGALTVKSNATRPAASTVAPGTMIYNSDAKAIQVSDGVNWYQDGVAPPFEQLITALGSAVKLWWKCDDAAGSSTLADASGNGKTGTGVVGSLRLPSLVGGGYSFCGPSGVGAVVTAPSGLPTFPSTMLLVINLGTPDTFGGNYFSVGTGTAGLVVGTSFAGNADGALVFNGNAGALVSTPGGLITAGRNVLIGVTIDAGKNVRLYGDGLLRAGPTAYGAATPNWSTFTMTGGARVQHLVLTNTEIDAATFANLAAAVPR